jgi:hypothetical protein
MVLMDNGKTPMYKPAAFVNVWFGSEVSLIKLMVASSPLTDLLSHSLQAAEGEANALAITQGA